MIEINDEESLKKENITIELFTKELIQKPINLKNKIEKEIDEINNSYNDVKSQINKKFKEEHEKLIIEENNLIEKLQNEVTKTKENLEKYLSESNEIIKNYEKINKGIKLLEKEQKNMIKELTYITKINKSKNEYNYLFNEIISNLKISFEEEQRKVKYEKYYFNIPIPKEIKFNDISSDSFKLEWKLDNLDKFDKNKIKYKVELRELNENINEKFNQVYFDSNTNCLITNLKSDTKYEIKICCIYNNIEGEWSEIQNIKTDIYIADSIILKESKREKELLEKIYEWSGYKKMELLYRGTRDGKSCKDFHNKCDNKGPTICLYKSEKGYIFGGYSPISWKSPSSGEWQKLNDSFIFTLTNIYDKPTKFPHIEGNDSVFHYPSYGPTFDDFYIYDNFECELKFPRGHKDVLGKGKSIFTGDNNDSSLNIKEIEVFKLFK